MKDITRYEVWAINQYGDEYLEGTFNTLEDAKNAAQQAWDSLSTYDQKKQRIEVRSNINNLGYDVLFVLNKEVIK